MKFFKHFVDSHRGKSLLRVRRELGMAGVGMYWTLVELCAEKLEKMKHEEFSEEHCVFEFDVDLIVQQLGTKRVRVGQVLARFQEAELLAAESSEYLIRIKMPKLLESLDRDSKRARAERAMAAPKIKIKIKKKIKSIANEETHAEAFVDFYSGYPRKIGKSLANKSYLRERKNGASHEEILLAMEKFRRYHESNGTDPKFIPHPATFLSGFRDWLDPTAGSSDLVSKTISISEILKKGSA